MKEDRYRKLKTHILFTVAIVFILLVSIVNFLEYQHSKVELEKKIELKSTFVEQVYKNIIASYKIHLTQLAHEIISRSDLLNAFETRQREDLRNITYPVYLEMQENIEGFSIMHFHLPNGDSFLRLHALENFGDNLSDIRAMIQSVHQNNKATYGFEMGKFDDSFLTYRIAIPIFNKKQNYLGTVELGVNSQAILNTIKDIFSKIDANSAFFVERQKLQYSQTLPHIDVQEGEFILASKNPGYKIESIVLSNEMMQHRIYDDKNIYQVKVYDQFIKNYLGQSIGVFMLQYEVTSEIQNYKKYQMQLIVVSLIVMLIILGVVNYGFNYYLHHINIEHNLFVKEHEKAQLILDSQNNLVVLVDNGIPILANRSFLNFFDVKSVEEFMAKKGSLVQLFVENEGCFSLGSIEESSWVSALKGTPLSERKVAIKENSHTVIFDIEMSEYEGEENLYVLTFDDITHIMSEQNELSKRVYKDSLTSIYNRRYYEKVIEDILKSVRLGKEYSILLFDIDRFKVVNDTYGHNFGDEVLQYIANTVSNSLRSDDIFIRWGGEEFVVLLPNGRVESSEMVAQKLRKLIKSNKIGEIYVTCSFGVTKLRAEDTKESLIQRADEAMYKAKQEGRDRVVVV